MKNAPLIGIGIELDWPLVHHYELLKGVLRAGRMLGWTCRIEPGLETSKKVDALPDRYDGIIARTSPALASYCARHAVPLVNVWTNSPAESVPTACPDYASIGRAAAELLLHRGFRNFGFISRAYDIANKETLRGIREVIDPHGYECHVLYANVPRELDEWKILRESVAAWLEDVPLPAAMIASEATIARHFADDCIKRGLLVPDDIAVLCLRENALVCGGIEPAITSISSHYDSIGESAVRMLAELMDGKSPEPNKQPIATEVLVHERRSTEVRPVDDREVARALRYVWDHSHQPMSVAEVANAVGLSRRRLERRFRKTMNQSINDVIVESRVERAKRILASSDDQIKFVAKAAGFSSSIRMAQVFAQHLGITPSAYRTQETAE